VGPHAAPCPPVAAQRRSSGRPPRHRCAPARCAARTYSRERESRDSGGGWRWEGCVGDRGGWPNITQLAQWESKRTGGGGRTLHQQTTSRPYANTLAQLRKQLHARGVWALCREQAGLRCGLGGCIGERHGLVRQGLRPRARRIIASTSTHPCTSSTASTSATATASTHCTRCTSLGTPHPCTR
jgi:hypothetical protein